MGGDRSDTDFKGEQDKNIRAAWPRLFSTVLGGMGRRATVAMNVHGVDELATMPTERTHTA